MFYFEEYLKFKGIHKSIDLYKIYTYIRNGLSEIHGAYYAVFDMVAIVGAVYTYYQKRGDNINNDINGIDIMNIDKAKIMLKMVRI